MSNKNITAIIVLILLVGAWVGYYNFFILPDKLVREKCQNFDPNWTDFVDCYGMISIHDAWDENYLSLRDHINNYEIARIDSVEQLKHDDNKLFLKNKYIIEGTVSNSTSTQYYQRLFQKGGFVTNYYSSPSDIPTYLIINYKSGEVEAYKDVEHMPMEYRQLFIGY